MLSKNRLTLVSASLGVVLLASCGSAPLRDPPTSAQASPAADASKPYHRFYQGFLVPGLSRSAFEKAANQQFLPLFPQAHPVGLIAYRPALPKSPAEGCALPDWIALLTFESEKIYSDYGKTDIGMKIRAAHAPVFDAGKSRSAVPTAYTGTVQTGQAYVLDDKFDDYVGADSALLLHCNPSRSPDELLEGISKAYANGSRATNIVFAASPKHVAEYVFFGKSTDLKTLTAERKARFKGLFQSSAVIPLKKQRIGTRNVTVGEGLDAQW
jgi:hypothetical protein